MADDLQEWDPVCPTCRAPWAGIERLVNERKQLRADNEFLHQRRGELVIERDHARSNLAVAQAQLAVVRAWIAERKFLWILHTRHCEDLYALAAAMDEAAERERGK